MSCNCGNKKEYAECCGVFHKTISAVETAEQLMRSRYTAFTQANGDYLMKSHHSSTRPNKDKKSIVSWAKSVKWERLEIVNTIKGQVDDVEGFVEFKAYFKECGRQTYIHEKSRFIKENNHWVYISGEFYN